MSAGTAAIRPPPVALRQGATGTRAALLSPAMLALIGGFGLPLVTLAVESVQQFVPGRVGAVEGGALTLDNYRELLSGAFVDVLFTTFWIGATAAAIGQAIAFPLAYFIVRRFSPRWRTVCLSFLIMLVLSSVLVKTYAIELTFGSVGVVRPLLRILSIAPNSRGYIDVVVIAGLIHAIVPLTALMLIGAMQAIDPRLLDAAQSLGAPAWRTHLGITLPLALPALVSSFLVSLTFAISAFVIPMVLGKGRVLFLSNSIYTRFSDIANYPSGAALSLAMLVVSMLVIATVSLAHGRRGRA
ncbi:MAG: ABC transporter permease [Dyella sp.]|nr:ABC transporter permease [Dyella sp.]